MKAFIEIFLSTHLCGYRKGYNTQYALLASIEKWKCLDGKVAFAGAILMDLSKAFDSINHVNFLLQNLRHMDLKKVLLKQCIATFQIDSNAAK